MYKSPGTQGAQDPRPLSLTWFLQFWEVWVQSLAQSGCHFTPDHFHQSVHWGLEPSGYL